jgi:CheY-like chemotaxis protein/ribosomal protein L37E
MESSYNNLPFRYCPSCGERVYTYTVMKDDVAEVRCSSCGFPLSIDQAQSLQGLDCILIADDDELFRSILADLLVELGLTAKVISCESGIAFLRAITERFRDELPNKLAILDIIMEPLDGIATAISLRAIEKGLKVAQPTPILFLSALRYEEKLTRLIGRVRPALYLNKGSDATPDRLGPRLQKVIGHLLQQGRR